MKVKHFVVRTALHQEPQDRAVFDNFSANVKVKKVSTQFVPAEEDYWSVLVFYTERKSKKTPLTEADLSDEDRQLLASLRVWRNDQAKANNVPEFLICANSALMAVAKNRPLSTEALMSIKGFGVLKTARYGSDILAIVGAFS